MKPAIWSISLAGAVWVSLLALVGIIAFNEPDDKDLKAWFVFGSFLLIIFAAVVSSIVLAIFVLVKRRKGTAMAIVALALSALPFLLILAVAVRTALEPSSFM